MIYSTLFVFLQSPKWYTFEWHFGIFYRGYLQANLEIYHPGFKPKLLGFIASVMNSEVIILARLNNGDIQMLGDADRGAEIGENVEASSGKAVTDNNGATISFVYDTPTAQVYTGEMDSLIGQSTNLDDEPVTP